MLKKKREIFLFKLWGKAGHKEQTNKTKQNTVIPKKKKKKKKKKIKPGCVLNLIY